MRVRVAVLSLSAIQAAVNEMCDTITSLSMSRAKGVAPDDIEDISKPDAGRLGYNRATGNLSRFDGTTWSDASNLSDYAPVAHVTDAAAHSSLFAAKASSTHNHDTTYAAKGVGNIDGLRYNGVSNDRWYPAGCIDGRAITTMVAGVNKVYALPFSMSRALTLDGIAIDVSVLSAGNWRAGIYADGGGFPSARLVDSGSVAQAEGWNSATGLALALSADTVYWIAVALDSASVVRSPIAASMRPVFGWASDGGESSGSCYCYVEPGSLVVPNPFGSFTICAPGAVCPAVFMRFS